MEARLRDLELELEEEKRRHAETIKILRKKERTVKEVLVQCEEDQKNVILLQETLEKATSKVNLYKRQLQEQVIYYSFDMNISFVLSIYEYHLTTFEFYFSSIFLRIIFIEKFIGRISSTIGNPCPPFPT